MSIYGERSAQIVAGIFAGGVGGVVLVFVNVMVTGIATANGTAAPGRPREEFGPPTDRLGSAEYLIVQAAFLALAVTLLVVGIWRARRSTFWAVTSIVAALVVAFPFSACTVGAIQNARAAFTR